MLGNVAGRSFKPCGVSSSLTGLTTPCPCSNADVARTSEVRGGWFDSNQGRHLKRRWSARVVQEPLSLSVTKQRRRFGPQPADGQRRYERLLSGVQFSGGSPSFAPSFNGEDSGFLNPEWLFDSAGGDHLGPCERRTFSRLLSGILRVGIPHGPPIFGEESTSGEYSGLLRRRDG